MALAPARSEIHPATAPGALGKPRLDIALLALVVATCAVVDWAFASRSWFFADDFVLFHQVQLEGASPAFIFKLTTGHFSPGSRLLAIVVQRFAPLDFNVALGILLAFHCASIALLQRTLTAIFGRRWWSFVVAFAFGLSFVYLPGLEWFTAGLLTIPAITFSLACIHAFVVWWRTRRSAWLAWSVAALCLGLAFYEKTALVPVYLFVMVTLLLEPGRSVRAAARSVPLRVWALYVAPVIALAVIYVVGNFGESAGTLNLRDLPTYLRIAWLDGFAPIVLGVHVPASGATGAHTAAVVIAQLAIAAGIVLSIRRWRSAWRAWALLAGAFVVNMLLLSPRLGAWGPQIAYVPRYYTELTMLLALIPPFAFVQPVTREPSPPDAGKDAQLVSPRPPAAILATGLLAIYTALVLWSDADITRSTPGRFVRGWANHLRADLARVRAQGVTPNLFDEVVSPRVIPGFVAAFFARNETPSNLVSSIMALSGQRVRFDDAREPIYRVTESGHLARSHFVSVAGGSAASLRHTGQLDVTGGDLATTRTAECVRAGPIFATLLLRLRTPLRGHVFTLRTDYRTSPGTVILSSIDNGVGFPAKATPALAPAPAGASRYIQLGALPTGVPTFAGIKLLIPRRTSACFSSLSVGLLRRD